MSPPSTADAKLPGGRQAEALLPTRSTWEGTVKETCANSVHEGESREWFSRCPQTHYLLEESVRGWGVNPTTLGTGGTRTSFPHPRASHDSEKNLQACSAIQPSPQGVFRLTNANILTLLEGYYIMLNVSFIWHHCFNLLNLSPSNTIWSFFPSRLDIQCPLLPHLQICFKHLSTSSLLLPSGFPQVACGRWWILGYVNGASGQAEKSMEREKRTKFASKAGMDRHLVNLLDKVWTQTISMEIRGHPQSGCLMHPWDSWNTPVESYQQGWSHWNLDRAIIHILLLSFKIHCITDNFVHSFNDYW